MTTCYPTNYEKERYYRLKALTWALPRYIDAVETVFGVKLGESHTLPILRDALETQLHFEEKKLGQKIAAWEKEDDTDEVADRARRAALLDLVPQARARSIVLEDWRWRKMTEKEKLQEAKASWGRPEFHQEKRYLDPESPDGQLFQWPTDDDAS